MKKTFLNVAIVTATLISTSTAVFAAEETVEPAHTTVHWAGSLNDIIPGDNIIITGAGGSVEIAKGDLGLKENGTFDSTEIILESHEYDSDLKLIGAQAEATWALDKVSYTWGDNAVSKTDLKVVKKGSGLIPIDKALQVGEPIPNVAEMVLKVKNDNPLDVTDITNPTATAQVNVTMIASFES